MNVETDKDVFGYVKNLMRDCQFGNNLDIYFTCPSQTGIIDSHKFNVNNVDELVGKMFDFSMSKQVSAIHSFGSRYGCVNAFEIVISESSDHQTNITPRMIDFFRLIVDPFSRNTLVEALKPKPQTMTDYLNWDGRFIIEPVRETNPWEYFECDGDDYV